MSTPTLKAYPIDQLMSLIAGKDRKAIIQSNQCMFCSKEATTFSNALSLKEYEISGMCQECQDDVFNCEPTNQQLGE